jgi:pimeloyl-CoA dehydrogenase
MDFSYEQDQADLLDVVDRFVSSISSQSQRDGGPSGPDWQKAWSRMAEVGLFGLAIDEGFGGSGSTDLTALLATASIGKVLLADAYTEHAVICKSLLHTLSNSDQWERLAPQTSSGQARFCLAAIDGDVPTRAYRDQSGWVLTGTKRSVFTFRGVDHLLISAAIDGESPPYQCAIFIVPSAALGVSGTSIELIDGSLMTDFELVDVCVPDVHRLGSAGNADEAVQSSARVGLVAMCLESAGILEKILAMTIDYVQVRRQFGKRLADFQVLQHRLADLAMTVEQTRSLGEWAAMAVTQCDGPEGARAAAMAAEFTRKQVLLMSEASVQMHGAIGMTDEFPLSRYVRRLVVLAARMAASASLIESRNKFETQ